MATPFPTVADFHERSYEAYGGANVSMQNAHAGFSGEIRHADLAWYELGNRSYAPSLRQFISPDEASPFDAGGLNRYAYCGGDPMNRIDPTGGSFLDFLGASLGILGAAIGVAVTGGALLGLIGAAGGITAAMTTTAGATMAASTMLEVASIVAEVGSVASFAAGNQKAAGLFGWVAFGAGLAAGGSGWLAGRAMKSGTRVASITLSPLELLGSSPAANGYKTRYRNGPEATFRDVHTHVVDVLPAEFTVGRATAGNVRAGPKWRRLTGRTGNTHWVAQTRVNTTEVEAQMSYLMNQKDGRPITVIMNNHGKRDGNNWRNGLRLHPDNDVRRQGNGMLARLKLGKATKQITYINMMGMNEAAYTRALSRPGDVVQGFCFSMADPLFMEYIGLELVHTYALRL